MMKDDRRRQPLAAGAKWFKFVLDYMGGNNRPSLLEMETERRLKDLKRAAARGGDE